MQMRDASEEFCGGGVWGGIRKILASRTFLIFLAGRTENKETEK